MNVYAISANYTTADFPNPNIDAKITIFEDQIRSWYHVQARNLEADGTMGQHSGFAVLAIMLGYFETIGRLRAGSTGTTGAKYYFWQGFLDVFPELQEAFPKESMMQALRDVLWTELRSGLYHRLMPGPNIRITQMPLLAICEVNEKGEARIMINPFQVLNGVEAHFAKYVDALRDPANAVLRRNFDAAYRFAEAR